MIPVNKSHVIYLPRLKLVLHLLLSVLGRKINALKLNLLLIAQFTQSRKIVINKKIQLEINAIGLMTTVSRWNAPS